VAKARIMPEAGAKARQWLSATA
ncbi:MAG: hypothetical protein RIS90_437, partial [Pseudomonadota bacterium]